MRRFSFIFIAFSFLWSLATVFNAHAANTEQYDITILNGRVIDPETGLDAIRNIGVKGDKIATITKNDIDGVKVIDASGKVVAPGFIDLHVHGQSIPAGRIKALDGVTTMLELESGVLPVDRYYETSAREGRPIHYGAAVGWAHARIAIKLGENPEGKNEAWFSQKFAESEWREPALSDEELASLLSYVGDGLDQGGLGIGVLLGYAPASDRKEFYDLAELGAKRSAPLFTHARFGSAIEPGSSFEAIEELIAVSAATYAHIHICHLNSIGLRKVEDIGYMIKAAQANGVRLSVEAYPYGAGSTVIGADLFRGEKWRERLGGVRASDFTVGGKRLTEAEFNRLQAEAPETAIVVHMLRPEEDPQDRDYLDQSVLFPGGAIASDGDYWRIDGKQVSPATWPLPEGAQSHPRSAGTYARFLKVYVRERRALSLIDAIEKISFIPARILEGVAPQMKRKGRLQEGSDADIVIFDLAMLEDRATYERPAQSSTGFDQVIVAGVPLVIDGVLDEEVMPGRPVRGKRAN